MRRERLVEGDMAYYRYHDTLNSDLDLYGMDDIVYGHHKLYRIPVLSVGGSYSGSSSYYSSPLASMVQTCLHPKLYDRYNSLGYQDSSYAGLTESYGRSYRPYSSVGLDSYDMPNRYPIRGTTYRSSYVPYLDLAMDHDYDLYESSHRSTLRRRAFSRLSPVTMRTGNLSSRRWYPNNLDIVDDSSADEEAYVEKMKSILSAPPSIGVPPTPSLIFTNVYVGTTANAENLTQLKSAGITHVLNCGITPTSVHFRNVRRMYGDSSVVRGYEGLYIEDADDCDLIPWLRKAHDFIERARSQGGSVLVCSPGVSRSGAVAIGYLLQRGVPLLRATRILKEERRVALCNHGFMRTLARYARALDMLDSSADLKSIKAPRYGNRRNDKFQMYRSYLDSI